MGQSNLETTVQANEASTLPRLEKAPAPEKLTISESIYHQTMDAGPTQMSHSCFRVINNRDEQPWKRISKATPSWMPLDFGWLAGKVGLFVVQNEEGRFEGLYPTVDMMAGLADKCLILGVEEPDGKVLVLPIEVRANETVRLTPTVQRWFIRCNTPEGVKFSVHAFAE